jgi:quercetin dioxygenase-like cupin family protein
LAAVISIYMDVIFGHRKDVDAQPVSVQGSRQAFIQWLTTKERGSTRYALRKFTIKPGGKIAMHTHKYEETLYILAGTGTVCAGKQKKRVGAEEYVYIGGSVPHELVNDSDRDFEFLCVIPYIDDMSIETVYAQC